MADVTPENWCAPGPAPDPQPRSAKLHPISPSALCSMGWRTLIITGLLRDQLARHFATPLNPEEEALRRLVWREDDRTGILIESWSRWRGNLVEKRPAVVIRPNARQNARLGIGDRFGSDGLGNVRYQTFWVGSHTLFCIHGSGAGVEVLATEVERFLTQFHPAITEYLNLLKWQVTEVGAVSELEEARESFVIPVTVGWVYAATWKLSYEAPKLRKVTLSTLLGDALAR